MLVKRNWLFIVVVVLILIMVGTVSAQSSFTGLWHTIDTVDGSDIWIAFSPANPRTATLRVVWRENFFSGCEGTPGIVRGVATIDPTDANVLQADLTLYCFRLGSSIPVTGSFVYAPATDTLSSDILGLADGLTRLSG